MNRGSKSLSSLIAVLMLCAAGCANLPGKPAESAIPLDPDKVTDFETLFGSNCSGCHGPQGQNGAALDIADPVYLAIADEATIKKVVTSGIAGTSMPAFAKSAGGMLTDEQVATIVSGLRSRYAKPDTLAGIAAPPYADDKSGDAKRGVVVYATFCASCHGADGKGGAKGSAIVDGTFLALLTDQELRTMVIVGRADLGAPDWRGDVPGRPMTSQEISDVVAWLGSQRQAFPGSPYLNASKATGEPR
jgi:cytochrome c oxidase cbb3-type subunit 3